MSRVVLKLVLVVVLCKSENCLGGFVFMGAQNGTKLGISSLCVTGRSMHICLSAYLSYHRVFFSFQVEGSLGKSLAP